MVVVDDNEPLAHWYARVLADRGADVSVYTDGFADLLSPEPWKSVDCAVVDLKLGQGSGSGVLLYLQEMHPEIRRVLVSAFNDHYHPTVHLHARLSKPTGAKDLLKAVFGDGDL